MTLPKAYNCIDIKAINFASTFYRTRNLWNVIWLQARIDIFTSIMQAR